MKKMALVDAAIEILKRNPGKALTVKELSDSILASGLWHPFRGGKTPYNTLYERITTNIKRGKSPFVKNENRTVSLHPKWGVRKRMMPKEKRGYVYAITNKAFRPCEENGKAWVKIGHSGMDVGSRLFNMQSGIPYNFDVQLLMETVAPRSVENKLHLYFEKYRCGADSDEYFAVDVDSIEAKMKEIASDRIFRGARILSRMSDKDKIHHIVTKSKHDPTKRGEGKL